MPDKLTKDQKTYVLNTLIEINREQQAVFERKKAIKEYLQENVKEFNDFLPLCIDEFLDFGDDWTKVLAWIKEVTL